MSVNCEKCKKELMDGWAVCPFCGTEVPQSLACAGCGKELDPAWTICPFCGQSKGGGGASVNVKDSVVKSLNQSRDNHVHYHGGTSGAGDSNVVTKTGEYCTCCGDLLKDEYFICPGCKTMVCHDCRSEPGRVCVNCEREKEFVFEGDARCVGEDAAKGYCNYYDQSGQFRSSLLPVHERMVQFSKMDVGLDVWNRLVANGLARIYHNTCETSLQALLWGQDKELIKSWFQAGEPDSMFEWSAENLAYDYFVQDKKDRAWETYDHLVQYLLSDKKSGFNEIEYVTLGLLIFNDRDYTERALAAMEAYADMYCTAIFAKVWKILFKDDHRAKCLLERAVASDGSCAVEVGFLYELYFGEHDKAVRLSLDEERAAGFTCPEDTMYWIYRWREVFNDIPKATRLLTETEQKEESLTVDDCGFLASAWVDLFGNEQEGVRLLKMAEDDELDNYDCLELAMHYVTLLGRKDEARRLYGLAEQNATEAGDLRWIARARVKYLDDRTGAFQLLHEAENKIRDGGLDGFEGLGDLARAWDELGEFGQAGRLFAEVKKDSDE